MPMRRSQSLKATCYDVGRAEDLAAGESYDVWVLLPKPIPSLAKTPKGRKEFEEAVRKGRYDLIHDKWSDAQTAARELSDRGGIETVQIVRVRSIIAPNATFRDGKQEEQ